MRQAATRKCLHCAEAFTPDPRNVWRQKYCAASDCKAASKRASQAKWQAAPENQDYHRGSAAVARVQAWRQANPGYSKRPAKTTVPLQDALPGQVRAAAQISGHAAAPNTAPPPTIPAAQQIESVQLQDLMAAPAGAPIQISCNAPTSAVISAKAALQDSGLHNPLF